jgi:hypothetical protein
MTDSTLHRFTRYVLPPVIYAGASHRHHTPIDSGSSEGDSE